MKDKNYNNRDLCRKKWDNISKEMDANGKYFFYSASFCVDMYNHTVE
jgi:hypothetical protein